MNQQFFEKQLADLLRSNKDRKLKLALRAGYTTVESYKKALEDAIGDSPEESVEINNADEIVAKKPVIHNVYILDKSSSMMWDKFDNALAGINNEIQELKKDDSIDTDVTVVAFGSLVERIVEKASIKTIPTIRIKCGGMTVLYDAIYHTIKPLTINLNVDEKVIIKIFTDGEENLSNKSKGDISRVITLAKELGFTITFVGTDKDVRKVIRTFDIDESNTLIHNNTPEDIKRVFDMGLDAVKEYRGGVTRGEDVRTGFYKSFK